MRGLEAVYMNKFGKKQSGGAVQNVSMSKSRLNSSAVRKSNPFRPTIYKFEDDPAELNVDTEMDGTRYGGSGKDMSMVIADRLDSLQKTYLTKTAHGGA